MWDAVDRLVDRAPGLADLRAHKIELFAARRWRALARGLPPALGDDERRAAVIALLAPTVLERVRAACEGPIMLLKGPEVAARYPVPTLRSFNDVDLLVPDPDSVHRALLAAGFQPIGDPAIYIGIHHLRPLVSPELPLAVEIHSHPKWVDSGRPPTASDLLAGAVPAAVGVDGILAPAPGRHALLLAVHSWAHEPLRRLRDLVDVAAMLDGADRDELAAQAQAWGIERLWTTTVEASDALLHDGRTPWALRLWAQNLARARERTVLENHLERWISPFWALPAHRAVRTLPTTLAREVGRDPGESWRAKLVRTTRAFRGARSARSEHDRGLERQASRTS